MFETVKNFITKHPVITYVAIGATMGAIESIVSCKKERDKKIAAMEEDTKKRAEETKRLEKQAADDFDIQTFDFESASKEVDELMKTWSENIQKEREEEACKIATHENLKTEADKVYNDEGRLYSPDELTPHKAILYWSRQTQDKSLTFGQILLAKVYPDKFKDDYKKEADELYNKLDAYDKYVLDIVIDAHYDILKGVM